MPEPEPLADMPFCPVGHDFTPCDVRELDPLVAHLQSRSEVEEPRTFPRGTHLPDGRLDLCKQSIGAAGAEALASAVSASSGVRHWLLGANGLGSRGAAAVAQAAGANPQIQTVYLGCNGIDARGVEPLLAAADRNPSFTSLWLKRNPLGLEGAHLIADFLARRGQLRTLDLVQTELTSTGARAIVEVLSRPGRALRRLYLSGNALGPEVAEALAELLRTNDTLQELYLGVNRLGDNGVRLLAEGLAKNRTLRRLSLASNGLGPASCGSLVSALGQHPALIDLDLGLDRSTAIVGESANAIGDEGAEVLAEWLAINPPLRRLDVQHNGLTNLGAGLLCRAVETNDQLLILDLGKGFAHGVKRRIHSRLQSNRARAPHDVLTTDPDIQAIRSVYRTAPSAARSENQTDLMRHQPD